MKNNEIHIFPLTEGDFYRRRLRRLKKENRNRIFLISVICALEFVLILAICGICNDKQNSIDQQTYQIRQLERQLEQFNRGESVSDTSASSCGGNSRHNYMLYLLIYLLPLQKGNKGQATKEKTYQTERN